MVSYNVDIGCTKHFVMFVQLMAICIYASTPHHLNQYWYEYLFEHHKMEIQYATFFIIEYDIYIYIFKV